MKPMFIINGILCCSLLGTGSLLSSPTALRVLHPAITEAAPDIDALIKQESINFGIPYTLFEALVVVESNKNPVAVSSQGAIGLSQCMPANFKRCGLRHHGELYNERLNLKCGALILREEYDIYKDWTKALTVYNCGRVNCPAGLEYSNKVLATAMSLQLRTSSLPAVPVSLKNIYAKIRSVLFS